MGDRLQSEPEIPTDRLFTGQRYDDTGLYYYGARYYDPEIGRFISPDTIVPDPMNPQTFNRYSYCLNNPLKYIDPSGHFSQEDLLNMYDTGAIDEATAIALWKIASLVPDLPIAPDLPVENKNNIWVIAGVITGAILADDVIGIGVADDILIPFVWGVAWIISGIGYLLDGGSVLESSAQDMPTKKDGYEPPKNWNGKKVKNPNGPGSGYPDKNGNVWQPTTHKGTHGFHWDVQHPGGGYTPVYPK